MASEYTKNYSFDLYTDNDKPNLRDQYNAAITKIDKQLHANATAISNNATAIADETTRATQAEQTNATAIADETTRATQAEQTLQTSIDAETTRAKAAEQTLQASIDAEKTRAEGAEQVNATAIAAEKTRAEGAERVNATAIAKETADRVSAVESVKEEFSDSLAQVTTNKADIATLQSHGTKLVVLGDSWSDFAGTGTKNWATMLAQYLGLTLVNYAKVGATFAFPKAESGKENIMEQAEEMVANDSVNDVARICIQAGVNDISGGQTFNNIQGNLVSVVNYIRNQGYKCPITYALDLPIRAITGSGGTKQVSTFLDINYNFATYFPNCNCTFVNLAALQINTNWYNEDGLHPNYYGHLAIFKIYTSQCGNVRVAKQDDNFFYEIVCNESGRHFMTFRAITGNGTKFTFPENIRPRIPTYEPFVTGSGTNTLIFDAAEVKNYVLSCSPTVAGFVFATWL